MQKSLSHRAWFALGVLTAVLMAVSLAQTLVAAGLYIAHAYAFSPAAMLNPIYSPFLAVVTGLAFTIWTLVRARRAR